MWRRTMVYAKETEEDGFVELTVGDKSVQTGHNFQAFSDEELRTRHEKLQSFHRYARSFDVAKRLIVSSVIFLVPVALFGMLPIATRLVGLPADVQAIIRTASTVLLIVSLFVAGGLLSYRAYLNHRVLNNLTREVKRVEREMRRRGINVPDYR